MLVDSEDKVLKMIENVPCIMEQRRQGGAARPSELYLMLVILHEKTLDAYHAVVRPS